MAYHPYNLQAHYVRTLRIWGDALEAHKDEAIEIGTQENYDRYLRGCEQHFSDETIDCSLVTYLKPGAAA